MGRYPNSANDYGIYYAEEMARLRLKQEALDLRMATFGDVFCDMCGKRKPFEYHEIISRGRTIADLEIRMRTFDPKICSLLCNTCHAIAPTPYARKALLAFNIMLYGYDQVYDAFCNVPVIFRSDIEFPER